MTLTKDIKERKRLKRSHCLNDVVLVKGTSVDFTLFPCVHVDLS